MSLAKVNLSVFALVAIISYFLFGPVIALSAGAAAVALVLIWNMVSTGIVLSALQAKRLTDASATNIIYRLFLSDAQKLKEVCNLHKTEFYLIDTHVPLAFSLGSSFSSHQVIVTTGIFKVLTRYEISAVIGHEIGHIKAGDSALNAMRLASSLVLSKVGLRPVLRTFRKIMPGQSLIAKVMLKPECRADAFSAKLCEDPKFLASALRKLERGVRAVQWSTLDKLPFLAAVSVVDPFAAQESHDRPEQSKTAYRLAELYRLKQPDQAKAA